MAMQEEITDILWEEMKTLAVEQQQCLYELLPDYIIYENDEHKYLKQNIGYAIFGPPENTKDASTTESYCYYKTENSDVAREKDTDASDTVGYDEKSKNIINKIYDKICKCTVETDVSQPIYFGTIYNMIFRPKENNIKPKKEEEKKKEIKTELQKETKEDEKKVLHVSPIPIFKIRRSIKKESENTKDVKQESIEIAEVQYETWYIDLNTRVYKSWADYTQKNTLPECTMVLPKDGIYQPDDTYPITDDYSAVWLEILESPACTWKSKLCNVVDIASNVVGFGAVGLSAVSLFTPLAPVVVISGLAVTGVTGAWSFGRNTQQLIDRSNHEESINVLDKEAFPHYLGIVGTAFGLGVIGGSAIISNVAARGMTVNTFARVAFNTVQGGSVIINGIGVIYQGYNMYDKYREEKTISVGDALNLATHLMFFCGSVVKIQFASDIIESTQGRIMNEYKESLSTKRLRNQRRKFNRIVRKAATNNTCKMSENAEVIRHIRNRQELLSNQSNQPNQSVTNGDKRISKDTVSRANLDNTSQYNIIWSFERGRLKVNGILLLDPIEYITRLIKLGIFIEIDRNSSSDPHDANDSITDRLARVLCELLSKLYISDDCPKMTQMPTVPDFEPLLKELSSMNISEDYFRKLFEIAIKLMKRSRDMENFLLQIFAFVWQYCKANLKQWGLSSDYCTQSVSGNKILKRIIIAISEAIDMIINNLFDAFTKYLHSSLSR